MASLQSIILAPLLPWPIVLALFSVTVLFLAFAMWRRMQGLIWRVAAFAMLFAVLLNPILTQENRQQLSDIVAIVVDDSTSNKIAGRQAQTEEALTLLQRRLQNQARLEQRVSRVSDLGRSVDDNGTRLIAAIKAAISEIPSNRLAGVLLISDGQAHDLSEIAGLNLKAPAHLLISGKQKERDRLLHIDKAPAYGIVGEFLDITLRIVDSGIKAGIAPAITMKINGKHVIRRRAAPGEIVRLPLRIEQAGQTIVELEVEGIDNELTKRNNKAVISVTGVRDRLRVLLISGQPHPGERTWRNILKSDPSVDLVHFTILRPPGKNSATPIRELSLISFPTRQLFQEKLKDFDLIIFDRFRRHGILASSYLRNVAEYVRRGGAVLTASGPAYAEERYSLFDTPLSEILPALPTGQITQQGYRPKVTELGKRHPVTTRLNEGRSQPWGRWFRLINTDMRDGQALMRGANDLPLLILDRMEEGRIAQILSDQMWLWDRGFEGGGPQSELLRRIAHWLMKEPELEEESLKAVDNDGTLIIERRTLSDTHPPITITGPDGERKQLTLKKEADGLYRGRHVTKEDGLYQVSDKTRSIIAAVGAINPKEFQAITATDEVLSPLFAKTGGAGFWLEKGLPDFRRVKSERRRHGDKWAGLVRNDSYIVTGVNQTSLVPGLLMMIILLALLALAWRYER